jgi:hypothetical protein
MKNTSSKYCEMIICLSVFVFVFGGVCGCEDTSSRRGTSDALADVKTASGSNSIANHGVSTTQPIGHDLPTTRPDVYDLGDIKSPMPNAAVNIVPPAAFLEWVNRMVDQNPMECVKIQCRAMGLDPYGGSKGMDNSITGSPGGEYLLRDGIYKKWRIKMVTHSIEVTETTRETYATIEVEATRGKVTEVRSVSFRLKLQCKKDAEFAPGKVNGMYREIEHATITWLTK